MSHGMLNRKRTQISSWSSRLSRRWTWRFVPSVLGLTVCWGSLVSAQVRPGGLPVSAPVFLPAPRELARELSRAAEDIQAERYVDGLARLDFLLNGSRDLADATESKAESAEDYFLPSGKGPTRRSLHGEAERMIGSLPEKGRQAYELAYGTDAAKQLDLAVRAADYGAIGDVSRRYGHTLAGQEATLLLGRQRLLDGQAREAASNLRRLMDSPHAAERFGAELQLLYVTALRLSSQDDKAAELLARIDDATWVDWGRSSDEWMAELPSPRSLPNVVQQWTMVGGNPSRNAVREADMPMRSVAWDAPNVIGDPTAAKALSDLAKTKRGVGELPTFQPLFVGDWVLFRTTSKLVGASLQRELERIWDYPATDDDDRLSPAGREAQMKQRVWENSLYGQVSTDGELAFLVGEIPDSATIRSANLSNQLVAVELASEGKLRWIVGKDDDQDEPALMGMFFLGAPLPLGDSLFCIGERNSEIRVMELERATGKLRWSQQLGHVEMTRYMRADQRRLNSLNLAYADGILVCPTGTGGVIGIDVTQRRFAWGLEYERRVNQIGRSRTGRTTAAWLDNGVVIEGGRVVLSPADSDELICLDLFSGERLWSQKVAQAGGLFVAGVHADKAIVVAKTEVLALALDDGKTLWRRTLRGAPSGRGIMTGQHYLLATTAPELIKLELESGKIVESMATVEPLGNLTASEDMIIAQNSITLRAFFQKEKLLRKVERRLAENHDDPWALEHTAYVLLDQGKQKEGVEKLLAALAGYPTLETPGLDYLAKQRLADETFAILLKDGGPESLALADRSKPFLPAGRAAEFLRVMAVLNLKQGRVIEAFEDNLDLFLESVVTTEQVLIEPSMMDFGVRKIRPERWHRAMFSAAWEAARDDQRQQLQTRFLTRLDALPTEQQAALVLAGQDLPFLHLRYLDLLSEKLATQARIPYVEGPLLRLSQSDDDQVASRATAELARLYSLAGQMLAAAGQYRQLSTRFADLEIESGRTGRELAGAAVAENASLKAYYEYQQGRGEDGAKGMAWGHGPLLTKQEPQPANPSRASNIYGYTRSASSLNGYERLDTEHGRTWNEGMQWIVSQSQGSQLEVRDPMGQTVTSLGTVFANSQRGRQPKIRTYGHLVVGALDNSIVALNGLHDTTTSASAELWREVRAGSLGGVGSPVRNLPFGQLGISRQVEFGPNGRSPLSLGSVSDRGIVFRRSGDLLCVDPATGDVLWERGDVRVEAEIWGDDEFVFAHVDQRYPDGGGNVRVFSVLDGTELESRPAPNQGERVRTYGQYVLTWKRDLGHELDLNLDAQQNIDDLFRQPTAPLQEAPQKELAVRNVFELRDLFHRTKRFEWSRSYSDDARATWLSHDELAVYDGKDGKFEIISVLDGKSLVLTEIPTELERVDSLTVERMGGLYVVSLGLNSDGNVDGELRYKSPVAIHSLQNIEVYAFSSTGEMVWGVPAKLLNFCPIPCYLDGIPLIVFARQNEADASRRKRVFETVVLDVRDGHLAFQSSDLYDASSRFRLSGRIGENQVELLLPSQNGKWTLTFTDEPRAPAVPYGYATNQWPKAKKRSVLGALYDTIFPNAEELEPKVEP